MSRSFGLWQLFGFAVTSFLGTVLHFLYEWSDKALWIAPFSGVNESTWEHMKLLFWPMLLFAILQYPFFRERSDFWNIKLLGITVGLVLIPIIFYTYNGAIGKSPDWVNIAIFFISAMASYLCEARLFKSKGPPTRNPRSAIALLSLLAVLFILFTFRTPKIGIFRDPISGEFGIIG